MANEADSFFYDHLAEYAGARTNPYAIRVASQICRDFKLSIAGQRRFNKALNDLPCIDTLDPGLSFAWSLEHVIRSPRVHRFGYEHLTIVVTLCECFHETWAAEVFHQLAKRVLPAAQTTPHIYQWVDLLHFCNGILATSDFGLVVENFIQLDPYSITPGGKYSTDRCLTPPESMAGALLAIAELTSGKRESLTLRGGVAVGWIAALVEQFFDITTAIESKQGAHLHGPTEGAKLTLIYTDRPEMVIDDSSMPALTQELSTATLAPFSNKIHFVPFGGRVTWTTLLPHVFGQAFHDLDHVHTKAMYTAIGTAFRAIEDSKDSSTISVRQGPHASLSPHPETPSASQLIGSLTAYLSSLQHGQARMERALKMSPQEAAKAHFEQIHHLASMCGCMICSSASAHSNVPQHNGNVDSRDATPPGYCLPSVVETIIIIGLMLSRIVLAQQIYPSREGVQLLYKARTDKFTSTDEHNILAPGPNCVATLYDDALNAPTSQILRMAVAFFAGGHPPPLSSEMLPSETVALAHDGICAFAAELAGGKGVRKDMKGMVRVVNGGFGIRKKTYKLAAWCAKRPGGSEGWAWDEVEVEHLKDTPGGKLWLK